MTTPPMLSAIIHHLERRPARLTSIIEQLDAWEEVKEFRDLIRAHLPELEEEILREPSIDRQVIRFGHEFGEKYFPVYDLEELLDTGESLCTLIQHGIPVIPFGIDPDELHELWNNQSRGRALLITMAQAPDHYRQYFEGDGERTAWLESAAQYVSQDILRRIPPGGIPIRTIEDTTRGTPLEPIREMIEWAYQSIPNVFLQTSHDEEYHQSMLPWETETIQWLTQEWQTARETLDRMHQLEEWLEADPGNRFSQVLDFILERAKLLPPTGPKEKE